MAFTSKCGSCGHSSFEIKEVNPAGSRYRLYFVQCSSCGVPVAVQDYYNAGAQLEEQKKKIESLERKLQTVESYVANIDHNLARLAQTIQR